MRRLHDLEVEQALIDSDNSMTNAGILIVVLLWLDGLPVVLIEDGRLMRDRMDKVRVDAAESPSSRSRAPAAERQRWRPAGSR